MPIVASLALEARINQILANDAWQQTEGFKTKLKTPQVNVYEKETFTISEVPCCKCRKWRTIQFEAFSKASAIKTAKYIAANEPCCTPKTKKEMGVHSTFQIASTGALVPNKIGTMTPITKEENQKRLEIARANKWERITNTEWKQLVNGWKALAELVFMIVPSVERSDWPKLLQAYCNYPLRMKQYDSAIYKAALDRLGI